MKYIHCICEKLAIVYMEEEEDEGGKKTTAECISVILA